MPFVAAAAATLVTVVPLEAAADDSAKRKVAIHVEGNFAPESREDIVSVLSDRVTIVDKDDTTAAMRKFGLTKPLGSAMTQAKTRSGLVPRLRKAAKDAGADGFIVGIVQRYSGKWRVYVVWLTPDGNDLLVDEAVSREGSEDDRRSALKGALSSVIDQFAPKSSGGGSTGGSSKDKPPPSSGGGDEGGDKEEPEEPSDKPKRVRHEAGSSIFSAEVGMEATGRFFSFSDRISTNLRTYDSFPAPAFYVAAEVYPAAWTTVPVLRDIGLTVSYARMFGLQSKPESGGELIDTVYQRFSAGLRVRIPISRPTGPVIGLSGQYYAHTFNIEETGALKGEIPNVDYGAIRAGVDGRFPVGRAAIVAGFDWIEPLSSGPVYERFTGPKVHGIGSKLGVNIKLASGFELRVAAEYARFFADFDPVLGDAYIAGGALDQYIGLRLGAAYVE